MPTKSKQKQGKIRWLLAKLESEFFREIVQRFKLSSGLDREIQITSLYSIHDKEEK